MLNTLSPAGPLRRAGMLVLRLPSLSEGLYFKITPELLEMPFYLFQWTAEIERHLAEHGVTQMNLKKWFAIPLKSNGAELRDALSRSERLPPEKS